MGVILLDTGVVVAFLSSTDKYHVAASKAIREAVGQDLFVISAISYAELLTGTRLGRRAEDAVQGFCRRFIEEIAPVDEHVADRAASLRAANRFGLADALILATAARYPAQKIIGTDAEWSKIVGYKVPFEQLSF
jgi:predicted nucleic acid-binding protein